MRLRDMSKFQLRIASPCRAPWDNMDGDERVRFCRECNRNVYNLSAMSEPEAHALIAQREGRVCVRFYQRRDGTVLTTDCPVGRKRTFLSKAAASTIALAGAAVGLTQLSACGGESGHQEAGPPEIMGEAVMGTPPVHEGESEHPTVLMAKIAPAERDSPERVPEGRQPG